MGFYGAYIKTTTKKIMTVGLKEMMHFLSSTQ
jgi:hypothetical protein